MKYYIRLPRYDGLYYSLNHFHSKVTAIDFVYKFYNAENGWFNLVYFQDGSWNVCIPSRAYQGDATSICLQNFDTKDEAIHFAREKYQADEEGKINLIDEA